MNKDTRRHTIRILDKLDGYALALQINGLISPAQGDAISKVIAQEKRKPYKPLKPTRHT